MIWGQYIAALQDLVFAGSQEVFAGDSPVLVGVTDVELDADQVVLEDAVTFESTEFLVRVGAFLDGLGEGDDDQLVRGVVYAAGELVAAGDDVLIPEGQAAGWVSLTFPNAGLPLTPGDYQYGVQGGARGDNVRWFYSDIAGGVTTYAGSSFADGAPATVSGGTHIAHTALLFIETLSGVRIPTGVADDYLATLPFDITQRVFRAGGVLRPTVVSATASWYGTTFDPTTGANAIVRSDGPLADLVGERILVTRRGSTSDQQVAVYVHDEREFPDELADEDLLLSSRAFIALADPAVDSLEVTVGVLP